MAFHTRLSQLALTCDFGDIEREIKTQTWLSITSQKLRMKSPVHSPIAFRRLKEHVLLENLGSTIEY